MRLAIFIVLLALTTSVSAAGSGGGSSSIRTGSTGGSGGYSDPKLIIQYPLQQGLMLYKITTYKYGW